MRGGSQVALNRAMHFCWLLLRWGWGTAGIRGWCASGEVDGSMDSKQVAVLLLLLLLDSGHSEEPGSRNGDQVFAAMERPGRSPAFLFHPQRFGRNTWGSWSKGQLSPRAREFWSLAAPQRFGKK